MGLRIGRIGHHRQLAYLPHEKVRSLLRSMKDGSTLFESSPQGYWEADVDLVAFWQHLNPLVIGDCLCFQSLSGRGLFVYISSGMGMELLFEFGRPSRMKFLDLLLVIGKVGKHGSFHTLKDRQK